MSAKKTSVAVPFERYAAPEYQAWQWLTRRRLKVCKKWLDSFEKFLADVGPKPAGQFLTLLDGDKPYQPGNCRWAPPSQRNVKPRQLTFEGETKSLAQWAKFLGVTPQGLKNRLKRMTVDEALAYTKYSRMEKKPARGSKTAGRKPADQKPAGRKAGKKK